MSKSLQMTELCNKRIKKIKFFIPIVYGRPAADAAVDSKGDDEEEEEEAGHSKAHLVDSRVSHKSFAVFPGIHLLTQLVVEGDLLTKTIDPKHQD